tara:strand:+ start:294 stop:623 length:330 start_codon:yes stop_codon:yes gene_type:complete
VNANTKIRNFGPGNNHKLIIEKFACNSMIAYWLQSYDSIIALAIHRVGHGFISLSLDGRTWDYSRTTAKHRNAFMDQFTPWAGNDTNSTTKRIGSGEIIIENLNEGDEA